MGRNMGITLYLIAKKHVYTHMPTYVYIHTHTHIHGKEFNFVTCLTSIPNLIILTFNTSFISYNLKILNSKGKLYLTRISNLSKMTEKV